MEVHPRVLTTLRTTNRWRNPPYRSITVSALVDNANKLRPYYCQQKETAIAYRFNAHVIKIIVNAKAKPNPTTMPYPNPSERGAVKYATLEDMAYNLRFQPVK